jgi:cytochrome c oxidase cbb3-type subunit IV
MDIGIVRGLITLALMLAFVGLVVRVYARGRKADFDAIARLPLEESAAQHEQDAPNRGDHK